MFCFSNFNLIYCLYSYPDRNAGWRVAARHLGWAGAGRPDESCLVGGPSSRQWSNEVAKRTDCGSAPSAVAPDGGISRLSWRTWCWPGWLGHPAARRRQIWWGPSLAGAAQKHSWRRRSLAVCPTIFPMKVAAGGLLGETAPWLAGGWDWTATNSARRPFDGMAAGRPGRPGSGAGVANGYPSKPPPRRRAF